MRKTKYVSIPRLLNHCTIYYLVYPKCPGQGMLAKQKLVNASTTFVLNLMLKNKTLWMFKVLHFIFPWMFLRLLCEALLSLFHGRRNGTFKWAKYSYTAKTIKYLNPGLLFPTSVLGVIKGFSCCHLLKRIQYSFRLTSW